MNGYRWIASSSSIASMRRSAMGSSLRIRTSATSHVRSADYRLISSEGSHDVDPQNDRQYLSISCPRCGWQDWTQL